MPEGPSCWEARRDGARSIGRSCLRPGSTAGFRPPVRRVPAGVAQPADDLRGRRAGSRARRRSRVFRYGVASGDVTATSVVLWTRVEEPGSRDVPVEWSMWTEGGRPVAHGRCLARAESDHTCHVLVEGLSPGTSYHYVFGSNGDRIAGRTRTLPAASSTLRIAVACCSRWGWPGFDRLGSILSEQPDLVLHLGDYIYEVGETPPDGPTTDPPHDCRTLDDYRRRYRQHRSHPSLRRLHAAVPLIAVWDDHEVSDNAPDPDDEDRRAAGQRAWREWMPTRSIDDGATLDRRCTIEGLVDLVLVDTRYRRRPPVDTDGPSTSRPDTALLDEQQWSGIEQAADTDVPWVVVANQVHVSPMRLGWLPRWRWPPWRPLVNPDQWDGFPAERERLADILGRARGTPVVLSGDLHAGWSRRLRHEGRTVAHELTAPSISGTTFAEAVRERTGLPGWLVRRVVRWLNPGIDHVDLERHGFLVVDLRPERLTATFVHHDGTRTTRTLGSTT